MRVDVRHHRLNVLGLSVQKFADEVGVTADVIRNLEATGHRPLPENAVKVSRYFGLTPDEMFSSNTEAAAA